MYLSRYETKKKQRLISNSSSLQGTSELGLATIKHICKLSVAKPENRLGDDDTMHLETLCFIDALLTMQGFDVQNMNPASVVMFAADISAVSVMEKKYQYLVRVETSQSIRKQ